MKLIIHQGLTDLNTYINAERTNRFIGASIKKDQTNIVAWECKMQKVKITTPPPYFFHMKWFLKNAKKDADNIVFAKKFILDGLVKAQVIPNDSQEYIVGFLDEIFIDKEKPRIEVSIINMT